MRLAMVKAVRRERQHKDVDVTCWDADPRAVSPPSFADSLARMRQSIFCLVLPGQSVSTRRLAEVMMPQADPDDFVW
jgi:hypothetical protein